MIPKILTQAIVTIMATAVFAGASRTLAAGPQYYELRVYSTQSEAQQQRVNDYWQQAAVPAYNRMGLRPVGVFTEQEASPTNKIYVLVPCDSLAAFGKIPARLAADGEYQKAAADFLGATKTNAAYERYESSLLVAFAGMKHLAPPPRDHEVFELRTYLSPGEDKGLNKIKMFESGEITVMKEVGLAPVFYGRMVAGAHMPCLMYMTCGENLDEHKKHWQGFSSAPVWKQLQDDPQYKDNMIGMLRVLLKRMPASQI
ncbi:MAG: NIPSNAP family protein [Verrucomicrobiota bacterium]|jgi:hypothetical protein